MSASQPTLNTYIALFRGINVGGKNSLPMKQLTGLLEDLQAADVRTYIQSGNVVFRHSSSDGATLSGRIGAEVQRRFGFEPHVLLLTPGELEAAIRNNPFPEAESDPGSLHFGFLSSTPRAPDLAKLAELKKDSERFQLIGRVFYLHAPDGIGRSRLAAGSERLLGVPMTDRNWNTVRKLKELATA